MASAIMIPAGLALINAGFPPEERGAAIGKWSAILALAIPLGPLIGGLAVDFLSWHYVFLLNVPLCLICLGLLLVLPRPPFEPPEPQPLDIPGSIVITASLGLMTFALLEAGRNGAFTLFQMIVLIVGAVLLIVFFELQKPAENAHVAALFVAGQTVRSGVSTDICIVCRVSISNVFSQLLADSIFWLFGASGRGCLSAYICNCGLHFCTGRAICQPPWSAGNTVFLIGPNGNCPHLAVFYHR